MEVCCGRVELVRTCSGVCFLPFTRLRMLTIVDPVYRRTLQKHPVSLRTLCDNFNNYGPSPRVCYTLSTDERRQQYEEDIIQLCSSVTGHGMTCALAGSPEEDAWSSIIHLRPSSQRLPEYELSTPYISWICRREFSKRSDKEAKELAEMMARELFRTRRCSKRLNPVMNRDTAYARFYSDRERKRRKHS